MSLMKTKLFCDQLTHTLWCWNYKHAINFLLHSGTELLWYYSFGVEITNIQSISFCDLVCKQINHLVNHTFFFPFLFCICLKSLSYADTWLLIKAFQFGTVGVLNFPAAILVFAFEYLLDVSDAQHFELCRIPMLDQGILSILSNIVWRSVPVQNWWGLFLYCQILYGGAFQCRTVWRDNNLDIMAVWWWSTMRWLLIIVVEWVVWWVLLLWLRMVSEVALMIILIWLWMVSVVALMIILIWLRMVSVVALIMILIWLLIWLFRQLPQRWWWPGMRHGTFGLLVFQSLFWEVPRPLQLLPLLMRLLYRALTWIMNTESRRTDIYMAVK